MHRPLPQVVLPSGALATSEVYMISHAEHTVTAPFVAIHTAAGATLRLSPQHFTFITKTASQPFEERLEVEGRHVCTGDYVWVVPPQQNSSKLVSALVTGVCCMHLSQGPL